MYRSLFMKCNGLRKPPVLRHRSLVCEPLEERTLLSVGTELQLLPITSVSGIETIWFQEATAAARENFHNGVSSLELIDNDASGISGHLTVPGLDYETIPTEISDFTRLDIPGWSTTYEVGQPELPVFRTTLTIPAGVDVVTDVTPLESISLTTADPVYPTQPDTPDMVGWEDTEEASIFWYDTDYYSGVGDSSASDLYWISDTITAGDNHSIAIEFYPFQYDAATGEVSVVTGFDFNIEFVESPEIEMVTVADTDFVSAAGDADYLIITADAYYDEILPLAEWKEIKGYNTYVATMSEVGTTEQDVYNYIKAAYDADSDRPDFVLLVGDHEDVPACEIVGHPYYDSSYLWYTDYDYMLLEGSDNVADLALGRLSGDTETQITTMVNKILTYECTPDATDRYSEILLAGQFQDNNDGVSDNVADRFFMEDLHRIADFLGGDYDFWDDPDPYDKGFTVHTKRVWDSSTSNTLYYRASSYPGRITPPSPVPAAWKTKTDVSSIATTINNGVGIVLHRDHGSANGWGSPSFSTASVNNLTNGDELPVVFSLNCSTGRFADVDAFGEAWLRNANGGAVTMTGAACVSYSGPNDSMHVGIFDSMWNDYDTTWQSSNFSNSWRFGEVMNYAKDRVFSGYGYSSSSALLAARLFNVLGDPELQIRTETPATMDVSYPESIIRGNSTDFTVYVTQNGSPVSDAMVAITHGEERWVGTTGANGELTFYNMTTDDIGLYDVVVTEQNSFPFQGTTESFPTNGVDLLGSQFDVVPDKLLPAGGMATADFSIQNLGDMAAAGFNVRFYMSDDATIDPATDMVLALNASDPAYNPSDPGVYRVTGLDTLATHSASVALVVPADDPFDTDSEYFIGMIVDADGEITENIEDNNANRGQDVDRDDVDYLPGPVDHFVWELDSLFKYVDVPFSVNITAIDSDGFVVTNYDGPAELTALVGGNEDIYFNDFESDDGGWVASATWDPVGNWEWGTPTSGPDEAFSGQNVWATVLDGDYTENTGASYLTQTFDFTGRSGVELSWQQWVYTRYFDDYAKVYVNGDLLYSRRSFWETSDYEEIVLDLSAYDNLADVEIVFALETDGARTRPGWYIDDINISSDVTTIPMDPTTTGYFVDGVWTGQVTLQAVVEDVSLLIDDGDGHTTVSEPLDIISKLPGDANRDGIVDSLDITILAGNWQLIGATWAMGDFDGNEKVNSSDVTILAGNWQASIIPSDDADSDGEAGGSDGTILDDNEQNVTQNTGDSNDNDPVDETDATLFADHWQAEVHSTEDSAAKPTRRFTLGVATVLQRESLPPHRFIAPLTSRYRAIDAVWEKSTQNNGDYTAIAKDIASTQAKKSTTIREELFALNLNPYADVE